MNNSICFQEELSMYENIEYALQEASKGLNSQNEKEILRGLGWATYALARKGAP